MTTNNTIVRLYLLGYVPTPGSLSTPTLRLYWSTTGDPNVQGAQKYGQQCVNQGHCLGYHVITGQE